VMTAEEVVQELSADLEEEKPGIAI